MSTADCQRFCEAARKVGATVQEFENLEQAAAAIAATAGGQLLLPPTPVCQRHQFAATLAAAGAAVYSGDFRQAGHIPAAGVTFSNFALADTGTVVLESTDERIRLATTLPERHFVIVDPATILTDNLAAAAPLTALHQSGQPIFVAYITGPSRTADIERVLTIGCHGPRELYILLVAGVSDNLLEN